MNKIYITSSQTNAYEFVKEIASKQHNIPENTLKIAKGDHGKPYFENLKNFHFNISHSSDLQAVAISSGEVGVDIEKIRKVNLRVARRFCEEECSYITECESDLRFFEIWTKKEALLKYKGTGLSAGLKSCCVFSAEIPIKTFILDGYILSVCGEGDFEIVQQKALT